MLKPTYAVPDLPPAVELETVPVLKALAKANRALAELKWPQCIAADIANIASTCHRWRSKHDAEACRDEAAFCKAASVEEVRTDA